MDRIWLRIADITDQFVPSTATSQLTPVAQIESATSSKVWIYDPHWELEISWGSLNKSAVNTFLFIGFVTTLSSLLNFCYVLSMNG